MLHSLLIENRASGVGGTFSLVMLQLISLIYKVFINLIFAKLLKLCRQKPVISLSHSLQIVSTPVAYIIIYTPLTKSVHDPICHFVACETADYLHGSWLRNSLLLQSLYGRFYYGGSESLLPSRFLAPARQCLQHLQLLPFEFSLFVSGKNPHPEAYFDTGKPYQLQHAW